MVFYDSLPFRLPSLTFQGSRVEATTTNFRVAALRFFTLIKRMSIRERKIFPVRHAEGRVA